ncbi:hypothetical protein K461DRAFT_286118 [Myriangium duriaei CBS 260.36]|uniref:CASTOR ACT domain-containing protein n=1 Tax=Myriangium duriaei CBS 260.36 TaxID=1168546 RepID=A0A9P4MHN5_9PEZI|nr:hypothetical protein K461DRAFT_286118 [Myriangium duriaei CBS 260.36]
MDRSLTLINAQIQFLDVRLALIHIPLPLYPHFIQPILKLLALVGVNEDDDDGIPRRPWSYVYPFTNISITTIECSIVCPRHLVQELFVPILSGLSTFARSQVSISKDDFVVIQVGGSGTEAGQRVLDLTAPLALAGISIFFITTYYSDYVLVPQKSRHAVVSALEEQGFAFEHRPNGYAQMTNISSPMSYHHQNQQYQPQNSPSHGRQNSSASGFEFNLSTPGTPPPATIDEWQTKTFATLKRNNIIPVLDTTLTLVSAGGHRSDRATQARLTYYITVSLLSVPPPRFLSLTLTDTDSMSITLDRQLLSLFPNNGADILLFSDEITTPIVLDLRNLPDESAGIVCGVAGRLLDRMCESDRKMGRSDSLGFNMSYLSTAKAGNVIVRVDEVDEALEALKEIESAGAD